MNGYEDMLDLPHHVSPTRPRMTMAERAAQFSPFAALTGFGSVLDESARTTQIRPELDDSARSEIDTRLQALRAALPDAPAATITYFRPDNKKTGGAICDVTGKVRKFDLDRRLMLLQDGTVIPLDDILQVVPG